MKKLLLAFLLVTFCHALPYDFYGTHYIASYKNCSGKMENITRLYCYFLVAVEQSGATILSHRLERFSDTAMTGMAILSESHASIHTYPEHRAVFVDLFTCGDNCDWQEFERVLVQYLHPEEIERKVEVRE